MIARKRDGGWIDYFRDDGETLVFSVRLPPEGLTIAELERFREHVLKLIRERENGPN